jgi:hypothetical protein
MVEERRLRALGAVHDRVQGARGAHQLQNFLADAVHIDGERDAAEADERYAKFLLAHDRGLNLAIRRYWVAS